MPTLVLDSDRLANEGRSYSDSLLGLEAAYTTWEGETLWGVVESIDPHGRAVIRFPDGRWASHDGPLVTR
jgi:hypothetical protein